ncbi:MAG: asparagine synthase (glutamine-hydrolyzing) [Acidobacteria bacterium]|nr:asparagine synthase (glutamine-hydrolyzing) [Acidobacteriota bacterium]
MCGIVAAISATEAPPLERETLLRCRDRMMLRGPDARGFWISEDRSTALGHTRLSIIDPDARSDQPLWTPDERYGVVFNGEIYNYRDLKRRLTSEGYSFSTASDTEVLLALYASRGEAMLNDLRGMFAFVILDRHDGSLFAARDRLGIKPLYWSSNQGQTFFASQVRALAEVPSLRREVDDAAVAGYLMTGSVPEPRTLLRSIRALPAGSWMRIDAHGSRSGGSYYSIAERLKNQPRLARDIDLSEVVRESLHDAVRAHMLADVPVGCFLSAGIDSGAIAGVASSYASSLDSLTISFPEAGTGHDEARGAAAVARQYRLSHEIVEITRDNFRQDLSTFLDAMDQPTIDGFNTWAVSSAAASLGWKVALSGLGGDEWFGTYPSFRWVPLLRRMTGSRGSGLSRLLSVAGRFSHRPKLARIAEGDGTIEDAYLLVRGVYLPGNLPGLIGTDRAKLALEELQADQWLAGALDPDPGSSRARITALEAQLYMRNQLLRDTDWASLAHAVEVRVPLVDHVLFERLAPLIRNNELRDKQLLALAPSPPLPTKIRKRKKTGFVVPYRHWLQSDPHPREGVAMRSWILEVLEQWSSRVGIDPGVAGSRLGK